MAPVNLPMLDADHREPADAFGSGAVAGKRDTEIRWTADVIEVMASDDFPMLDADQQHSASYGFSSDAVAETPDRETSSPADGLYEDLLQMEEETLMARARIVLEARGRTKYTPHASGCEGPIFIDIGGERITGNTQGCHIAEAPIRRLFRKHQIPDSLSQYRVKDYTGLTGGSNQVQIHSIAHLVKGTVLEEGFVQILAMMMFPKETATTIECGDCKAAGQAAAPMACYNFATNLAVQQHGINFHGKADDGDSTVFCPTCQQIQYHPAPEPCADFATHKRSRGSTDCPKAQCGSSAGTGDRNGGSLSTSTSRDVHYVWNVWIICVPRDQTFTQASTLPYCHGLDGWLETFAEDGTSLL